MRSRAHRGAGDPSQAARRSGRRALLDVALDDRGPARSDEPRHHEDRERRECEEVHLRPPYSWYAVSRCWLASRPSTSSCSGTRSPTKRSMTFRITNVMTAEYETDARTAMACVPSCARLPYAAPSAPAEFTATVAKIPVASAPHIPPTPCTPNTSSASSTL